MHAQPVKALVHEVRHHVAFDRHVFVGEVHEVLEQSQAHERDVALTEDVHVADDAVLHESEKEGVDLATHAPCRALRDRAVQAEKGDEHDLYYVC